MKPIHWPVRGFLISLVGCLSIILGRTLDFAAWVHYIEPTVVAATVLAGVTFSVSDIGRSWRSLSEPGKPVAFAHWILGFVGLGLSFCAGLITIANDQIR